MNTANHTNFDQSSTGINIEATCYYDIDRSQWEFTDNFKILQYRGYHSTAVCYYIDNGNVSDESSVSFVLKGNLDNARKWLSKDSYWSLSELRKWKAEEIRQEILDRVGLDIIHYALDKLDDRLNSLADYGLEILPNKSLFITSTTGYCQGDYAVIVCSLDDLEKAWGNKPDTAKLKETFDRLYWDAPIYSQVTINGDEYAYWDCPAHDDYEWKREEFLEWLAKESGVDVDTIGAVLPSEPSYI